MTQPGSESLPTGRPTAPHSEATRPATGIGQETPANVYLSSAAASTDRPARGRAARLRQRLSERDLAVLDSLHRLRLATSRQLQRLHVFEGSALTQARRTRAMLQRLCELRVVVRLGRTIGGVQPGSTAHVYGLSGLGLAVLEVSGPYGKRRRTVWETKPYFLHHVLAVAELCVRLTELARTGTAELLTFDGEPACWRRTGDDGVPRTLKPDSFVRLGVGEYERSAFVEVDLATESLPTVERKCLSYISYWRSGTEQQAHGVFPVVLWLTSTEARLQKLQEVITRLAADARHLFAVMLHADGPAWLTAPAGEAV
jgi:Replication-relaxation